MNDSLEHPFDRGKSRQLPRLKGRGQFYSRKFDNKRTFWTLEPMGNDGIMTTDQKACDAKVVALFVREPETTLTAAAHQLGCTVWEVRKACYRAGFP